MAISHATRLHDGPIVDEASYRNLAGTYFPQSGSPLVLIWHGGGIIVEWPDTGTTTQIFPITATEFKDGYRRMKFAFGDDGRPRSVWVFDSQKELFTGVRKDGN